MREDDLAWAEPYVDEAREQLARGQTVSDGEFFKWLDDRIDTLRAGIGPND